MKKQHTESSRSRVEILAKIAAMPPIVQGKICEDRRVLASGKVAVYHNLQYWADGRNHTIRIPAGKLGEFREAAKNGETLKKLVAELAEVDARALLDERNALKKNSSRSS